MTSINVGQDKAAEKEEKINGQIAAAPDPRKSAAGKHTEVKQYNGDRRKPAQRGQRRKLFGASASGRSTLAGSAFKKPPALLNASRATSTL